MSIIPILQYPNSRLRIPAKPVADPHARFIQETIDDMLETLANSDHCAALAANQLDLTMPPAITVINHPEPDKIPFCLINPKIVSKEDESIAEEGCMSFYPKSISAKVNRANKVVVHALDRHGNEIVINAEDFFARCLQHEIDHLNGILFIDYLSVLKRERLEKKIAKLAKE